MIENKEYMLIVVVEHDPMIHNDDFMTKLSDQLAAVVKNAGLEPISSGLLIGSIEDIGEGV